MKRNATRKSTRKCLSSVNTGTRPRPTIQFLEFLALVEMQRHIGGANAVQCHFANGRAVRLSARDGSDGQREFQNNSEDD
jgi:hypothetical protein